jgi:hypothetical protein
LQVPSVPQVVAAATTQRASGSWLPAGTLVQVPASPLTAHDLQVPVHAVAQQTPCSQKPEPQSAAAAQVPPSGFFPQLMAVQTFPVVHSADVAQVPRHPPVPPQRYGAQVCVVPIPHMPVPSQRPESVWVDPVQLGDRHTVAVP